MLTDQELTEIRRVWTLLEPAQSFVERSAHNDISALLEHITELESIMRDMQDDSLAYREGVKAGLRTAMRMIAEDHQTWGKRLPGIPEEEARTARFALSSLLSAVEERCKQEGQNHAQR